MLPRCLSFSLQHFFSGLSSSTLFSVALFQLVFAPRAFLVFFFSFLFGSSILILRRLFLLVSLVSRFVEWHFVVLCRLFVVSLCRLSIVHSPIRRCSTIALFGFAHRPRLVKRRAQPCKLQQPKAALQPHGRQQPPTRKKETEKKKKRNITGNSTFLSQKPKSFQNRKSMQGRTTNKITQKEEEESTGKSQNHKITKSQNHKISTHLQCGPFGRASSLDELSQHHALGAC
jgi:hypothetical protein